MLPGKKYKPEDLLAILRKRIWWVLVPFAFVAAGTAAVARKLPDRYYSESLVRVVPQQVPEEFVKSTLTTRLDDRLQAMSAQILSRTRLERVIEDFNLYPDERRKGIMEDVIQQMRDDVSIKIQKGDVFSVGYTGSNPRTVQKVAQTLTEFFISDSTQDRTNLAEGTNQFLEAQLEDARHRLVDQENKLKDYRMRYSGQLPTQLESNLQAQANTQMQIHANTDAMNRDQERRLMLESQAKELDAVASSDSQAPPPVVASTGDAVQGGSAAQQLEIAKAYLAGLQKRFKDDHPDVRQWKKIVADLQVKADAEALQRPVSAEAVPQSPVEAARQKKLRDLRDQITQIDRQIAAAQAEVKRLRAINDDLQQRIDAVPARESELTELTRDYATLSKTYDELLARHEESKIAANLELRQYGERFKTLDSARIPEKPNSPNRPLINLGGMAAGLAIGLGLVALLEYRDRSFKTDDEIVSLLALPVLAVVPVMESTDERHRTRRRKLLWGIGLGGAVAGCFAILIYTFVR